MKWSSARLALLATVALCFAVSLACRWRWAAGSDGPQFRPRPDALEYAASAQSIAQDARFYLQLGPDRVRSRYSPGWPLVLAGALRLGVAPMSLWRVAGVFGAVLSAALAVLAWTLTGFVWRHVLSRPHDPPILARAVAGLFGGMAWALSPGAIASGRTTMSDEPTAALASLSLLALFFLLARTPASPLARRALAVAAGASAGLVIAMRPIEGVLLLFAALAGLLVARLRLAAPSRTELALYAASALVFPVAAMTLLVRSGNSPWQLTAYDLWMPHRFATAPAFALRYALRGSENFHAGADGSVVSNLELAARVLLGLPGLRWQHTLALAWPVAGWAVAFALIRCAARNRRAASSDTILLASTLAATWLAGHLACFSLYFFPAGRFYLAPFALLCLLSAAGTGAFVAGGASRLSRAGRLAIAAGLLAVMAWCVAEFAQDPKRRFERLRVAKTVSRWLARTDAERAQRRIPFDPVEAQALGLLPPEVCAQVREWGLRPDTLQMRRLKQGAPSFRR